METCCVALDTLVRVGLSLHLSLQLGYTQHLSHQLGYTLGSVPDPLLDPQGMPCFSPFMVAVFKAHL